VRRFVIASLPFVAAAVVVTLVLGSRSPVHHAVASASARPTTIAYRPPLRPRHEFRLPPAPAQLRGAAARRTAIPILTYHVVGTPAPGVPYPQLWVSRPAFAAEMAALRRAGYWGITLAQAWRAWTRGGPLPRRPVVVSFDDGYRGDYTHARPVLRRLGWPGLLNLELDNVDAGNLRASEVRGLIRSGWEIASHTVDHPDLTTVSAARVRYELTASRSELRRRFGTTTRSSRRPCAPRATRRRPPRTRAGPRRAHLSRSGGCAWTAATPLPRCWPASPRSGRLLDAPLIQARYGRGP
jgi:peptidoglycan/xylan/chitin deacetylase (PgdA/CDA1 family)